MQGKHYVLALNGDVADDHTLAAIGPVGERACTSLNPSLRPQDPIILILEVVHEISHFEGLNLFLLPNWSPCGSDKSLFHALVACMGRPTRKLLADVSGDGEQADQIKKGTIEGPCHNEDIGIFQ